MRNSMKMMLAGLAFTAMGSAAAKADLTVQNEAGQPVWYTIYDFKGEIVFSGCLANGASQEFNGFGTSSEGNINYVRGELKNTSDCVGKTLSDTGRGPPISIGAHTLKQYWDANGKLYVK